MTHALLPTAVIAQVGQAGAAGASAVSCIDASGSLTSAGLQAAPQALYNALYYLSSSMYSGSGSFVTATTTTNLIATAANSSAQLYVNASALGSAEISAVPNPNPSITGSGVSSLVLVSTGSASSAYAALQAYNYPGGSPVNVELLPMAGQLSLQAPLVSVTGSISTTGNEAVAGNLSVGGSFSLAGLFTPTGGVSDTVVLGLYNGPEELNYTLSASQMPAKFMQFASGVIVSPFEVTFAPQTPKNFVKLLDATSVVGLSAGVYITLNNGGVTKNITQSVCHIVVSDASGNLTLVPLNASK
jgi:hypothetical protein